MRSTMVFYNYINTPEELNAVVYLPFAPSMVKYYSLGQLKELVARLGMKSP